MTPRTLLKVWYSNAAMIRADLSGSAEGPRKGKDFGVVVGSELVTTRYKQRVSNTLPRSIDLERR